MDVTKNKKKIKACNDKSLFNKKKWREEKYSNKAKVLKWENNRRRLALRDYNKQLKKLNILKSQTANNQNKFNKVNSISTLKQAQQVCQRIIHKKEENRKKHEMIKKEREEALKAYKLRKSERYKKLCQKTKKGQPLMRGRLELLLEKIQKDYVKISV